MTSDQDLCMVETIVQAMANEKTESLEKQLVSFQNIADQMHKFMETFKVSTSELHPEAYGLNEDLEGESSHHIHFHGNHQHSHPWPPKLDMYKFDGSNRTVWVEKMEQYFLLNDIRDDPTKIRMIFLYLDQERWQWWQWHKKYYPGKITWQVCYREKCLYKIAYPTKVW